MTFTDKTSQHLANLVGYYADKARANARDAIMWRELGLYPASVKHHAELAAQYAQSSRFYRDRLVEWEAMTPEHTIRALAA